MFVRSSASEILDEGTHLSMYMIREFVKFRERFFVQVISIECSVELTLYFAA